MPHRLHPELPARLARTERDLLERVPLANRAMVLRRMLAALDEADARALETALRSRADAASWFEERRDVA